MQELPVLQVTQGEAIADEFTLKAQILTGYTGVAKFKRRYAVAGRVDNFGNSIEVSDPFLTAPVTVTVVGADTVVTLAVADTTMFPVLDRIGPLVTAFAEIRLTGAGGVQTFQRPVAVARAF